MSTFNTENLLALRVDLKGGRYEDLDCLKLSDDEVLGLRATVTADIIQFSVRYTFGDEKRELTIGDIEKVSLEQARIIAQGKRNLAAKGIDPAGGAR
jgi:hypothetical protein